MPGGAATGECRGLLPLVTDTGTGRTSAATARTLAKAPRAHRDRCHLGLPWMQALLSPSLPGPWREVPGTRPLVPEHGLQARTASTRRLQPPGRASLPGRPGKRGLSTETTCVCPPTRGSPRSLPWCRLRTGPPRPRQAALAAERPPHPSRLVEVSYLIGNPWRTSEENVRMLC